MSSTLRTRICAYTTSWRCILPILSASTRSSTTCYNTPTMYSGRWLQVLSLIQRKRGTAGSSRSSRSYDSSSKFYRKNTKNNMNLKSAKMQRFQFWDRRSSLLHGPASAYNPCREHVTAKGVCKSLVYIRIPHPMHFQTHLHTSSRITCLMLL